MASVPISPTDDEYAKAMLATQTPVGESQVRAELPAKYTNPKTLGLNKAVTENSPNKIELDIAESSVGRSRQEPTTLCDIDSQSAPYATAG